MNNKPKRRLITIHYKATWGSGANGGIQGDTDATLKSLRAHLAKYAPGATLTGADCYDIHGNYLHSYGAEAKSGEPIRADLLLEAGWIARGYQSGMVYEKVFYNSGGYCRGFVKVDINRRHEPISPSVYLVTFADGYDFKPKVEIPLKRIKTMEGLGILIEMLGE